MKLAVCLKLVPETTADIRIAPDGRALLLDGVEKVVNPYDEYALEAALRSKSLHRAPAMARILEYICLEHLAGRGEEIKEYNIAIEGLGRPADFDASRDSIVRVEVSRLRHRLAQYYDSEGAGDSVRIVLTESGYNPQFVRQAPATPVEPESAGVVPETAAIAENPKMRTWFDRRTWLAVAMAAILVVALILWALLRPEDF